uniref:Uncharacterized protein n=1 Tax=Aureoumbra lagunensis TaxID=44058 RepID=A0A7S3NQ05_9STRA
MAARALEDQKFERRSKLEREVKGYRDMVDGRLKKRRARLLDYEKNVLWIEEPGKMRFCFRKAAQSTSDDIRKLVFEDAPSAKLFLSRRKCQGNDKATLIQAQARRLIIKMKLRSEKALTLLNSPRTRQRRHAAEQEKLRAKLLRAHKSTFPFERENELEALAYLADLLDEISAIAYEGTLTFARPGILPTDGMLALGLIDPFIQEMCEDRQTAANVAASAIVLQKQQQNTQEDTTKNFWHTLNIKNCFDESSFPEQDDTSTLQTATTLIKQEEANCELRFYQQALERSLSPKTALCVLLASASSLRSFEEAWDLITESVLPLPLRFIPKFPLGSKRILCFLDARDGMLVAASSTQHWLDPHARDDDLVDCLLRAFTSTQHCQNYDQHCQNYDLIVVETYYFEYAVHVIQSEPIRCAERDISVSLGLFSFDELLELVSSSSNSKYHEAQWQQKSSSLLVYSCFNANRRFEYRVREFRLGATIPRKEQLFPRARGSLDLVIDNGKHPAASSSLNYSATFSDDASSVDTSSIASSMEDSVVASTTENSNTYYSCSSENKSSIEKKDSDDIQCGGVKKDFYKPLERIPSFR